MNIFSGLLFCIVVCLCFSESHSQEQIRLDPISITSNFVQRSSRLNGRSTIILTEADISKQPVNTVEELLRYLPGININSRNGFGVQSDIGMRGSTFSQVIILIDHVRLNDPLTAHFNNNIPISLAEISRIEIILGPASLEFGADAVGGVIHIISKAFMITQEQEKINFKGKLAVGDNKLISADAGIFAQHKKLFYGAGIKSNISEGEVHVNPNYPNPSAKSHYNSHFDLRTYSASLGYLFNDTWKLRTRLSYDNRAFDAKYFYTRSSFDESKEFTNSLWTQLALERRVRSHQSSLNVGYKRTHDLFVFNPLFTANEHTTKQLSLQVNHRYSPSYKVKAMLGAIYELRNIDSSDRGDHEDFGVGVFASSSVNVLDYLQLTGGLRLQYDSNYDLKLIPQLSLAFVVSNHVFRASAGRAVRAGDFTERYISNNIDTLSAGRNLGNPNLKAEDFYSFDVGFESGVRNKLKISTSLFYRIGSNLIDYSLENSNNINSTNYLFPDADYFYTTNIAESNTYGIELGLNAGGKAGYEGSISGALNYTFLKSDSKGAEPSKYLANHPTHNFSALVSYTNNFGQLSSSYNYIHRNRQDALSIAARVPKNYSIWNAKLAVNLRSNGLKLFTEVNNILDFEYQEILGAQMPGRWWSGGIQWNISH